MRITVWHPYPPNTTMAPGALDSQLGKTITLRTPYGRTLAMVCGYELDERGFTLALEVEDQGDVADVVATFGNDVTTVSRGWSVGYRAPEGGGEGGSTS